MLWISFCLPELIRKKTFFCQAYRFNFWPNQDSFFPIHKNFVRRLAWNIKFKKRKEKNDKGRMNANSVASQIKVEFLHVRRYDKRNRTLLSNTFNALVVYNLEVLEHVVIENHT